MKNFSENWRKEADLNLQEKGVLKPLQ